MIATNKTPSQKGARRMVEAKADRRDLEDGAALDADVRAELRATVADALHSSSGTVYRFGALVIAFRAGRFFGVGVETYHGVSFEPAVSR